MQGDNTSAIRPFGSVVDRYRSVAARLDTTFLKRVGVVTYFGVYAAIALGGRDVLNEATGALPAVVRPPLLAPLHVALGLPRSVAWALVSFTTMLVVLGVLVAVSLYRDDHATEDRPARLGGTSLTGTLAPTTGARAVGRRVRSVGRRVLGSVPESPPSLDDDRPSPSTDGGATFDPEASGPSGSVVGDDGPAQGSVGGPAEESVGSPTGGDPTGDDSDWHWSDDSDDEFEEYEVPGDEPSETGSARRDRTREEATVDPLNPFGDDVPVEPVDEFDDAEVLVDDGHADDGYVVDGELDGDAGDVVADRPETADSSDAPDEAAPWPDDDGTEAEDVSPDADGDEEEPSADAEWPGDWISGDEL